jgi:hypothetical protein
MTTPRDPIYAGHRYPAEIISYAVWLYFRFPLSLRMVEEMLAARGISVTHETIRHGASNSAGNSPTAFVGERLAAVTNGTSMRSSSASPERSIGSGVPSTRMGSFSMAKGRQGSSEFGFRVPLGYGTPTPR